MATLTTTTELELDLYDPNADGDHSRVLFARETDIGLVDYDSLLPFAPAELDGADLVLILQQ